MRTLFINPDSNSNFTDLMNKIVDLPRATGGCPIDYVTQEYTLLGVESQRVIAHTDEFVIGRSAGVGFYSARHVRTKRALGICKSGLSTALNLGERFGVISTSSEILDDELRPMRSFGPLERCVRFELVDVLVADIATVASAKVPVVDPGVSGVVMAIGVAALAPG